MSHRATTTFFTLLGLLTTLNLIVLGINISLAVESGGRRDELSKPHRRSRLYPWVGKTIAQECKVNVDIAKLMC